MKQLQIAMLQIIVRLWSSMGSTFIGALTHFRELRFVQKLFWNDAPVPKRENI